MHCFLLSTSPSLGHEVRGWASGRMCVVGGKATAWPKPLCAVLAAGSNSLQWLATREGLVYIQCLPPADLVPRPGLWNAAGVPEVAAFPPPTRVMPGAVASWSWS